MSIQNTEKILNYINLDLNNIPKEILNSDDIDIKSSEIINQRNYKVYRYLSISDINIVFTNNRRLDEPSKKIENMEDLSYYLNKKNEEEYATFLKLIENADINDIEEIEKFQNSIKKSIPSKIKYSKDYIWQIYYIERTNKYYMIVPLQETETQGLFYLLKNKIGKNNKKIYVPICNIDYNNKIIEGTKINALESNLNYFTKEWPSIYEVHDINENVYISVIGNVDLYANIKSAYKMTYTNKDEIMNFYKLLQTLVYLNTEIPNFYKFDIVLNQKGEMSFYYNNQEISINNLNDFYLNEIKIILNNIEEIENIQKELNQELIKLKLEEKKLHTELLYKQKQISTFLECKKTFFGRVKYFFKYSKKKTQNENIVNEEKLEKQEDVEKVKPVYTKDIEDLIYLCKEFGKRKTITATTKLDIQNIKIKIDISKKKIENATKYINEIESHKKSIFEFWKFTNKDESNQLSEGITNIEETQRIEKEFDINEDLKEFAKQIDIKQRKNLTLEEQNSIFAITKIGIEGISKTGIDWSSILESNETDSINYHELSHRERPKNIRSIVNEPIELIEKKEKGILKKINKNMERAFTKCKIDINLPVYSLIKPMNKIMMFEIDPRKAIAEAQGENIYRINLKKGTSLIALSNIIFFNNRNNTLPNGMDYSTNVIVDLRNEELTEVNKEKNNILRLIDNSPKQTITKLSITEFNI